MPAFPGEVPVLNDKGKRQKLSNINWLFLNSFHSEQNISAIISTCLFFLCRVQEPLENNKLGSFCQSRLFYLNTSGHIPI